MNNIFDAAVVVVNWNGALYLENCIQSVIGQSLPPAEIIVIDNHSSDGSREILKKLSSVKAFFNKSNVGFSVACNQGIKNSQSEFVLILNSDVILGQNYLEEAIQTMRVEENIGMVTGKVLRFDQKTIDTCGQSLGRNRRAYELGYGSIDKNQFNHRAEVFSICGAVALYRRKMLEDVSIHGECFDEEFFAFYEDIDLGWRARNLGWKGYFTPFAVAFHHRGGTNHPRNERLGFLKRYEFTRRPVKIQAHIVINRYLMIIKNDRLFYFLRDLPFIIVYEIFLWGYILFFRPKLIWEVFKGLGVIRKAYRKRSLMKQKKAIPLAWG